MVISVCQHETRIKRGRDRNGNQRWKCCLCGKMFASDEERPLGDMRTSLDDAAKALTLLLEGMSISAVSRFTGLKADTICDLVLVVGENCQRLLAERVKSVPAEVIEMDEIWDFVRLKGRTKERLGIVSEDGDAWTWLAIDANTKLVLTHAVGLRDEPTCERFLRQLDEATTGPCQVTSDGLTLYKYRVPAFLGSRAAFAQLIKTYATTQTENRYSPASIIDVQKHVRFGNPDEDLISTSYAERLNLSLRMHCRRYTRLTNAHSKTVKHHTAMTAIFCGWYNFCRPNMALGKKTTPAMAANLTSHVWTVKELLEGAVNV